MYESPLEFHFWLLGWRGTGNQIWHRVGKRSRIPSYPGGVNLLHRVNYWLTLDLVASGTANASRSCNAMRVNDSSKADVYFVPFSILSYNRHLKALWEAKVELFYLLKHESDVHFTFGSIQAHGILQHRQGGGFIKVLPKYCWRHPFIQSFV
ncbi:hypothetical protein AAHA92_14157 [Salvia divinorum]|uniref:Maturase K n=1 Tax=Salvia divinorum TaxID=28513 RepID=A0ABD1HD97_SALDI